MGADINAISFKGVSVLYYSITYSTLEIVKYLISQGANPNLVEGGQGLVPKKRFPLIKATIMLKEDIVSYLLTIKSIRDKINETCACNYTALHYASFGPNSLKTMKLIKDARMKNEDISARIFM